MSEFPEQAAYVVSRTHFRSSACVGLEAIPSCKSGTARGGPQDHTATVFSIRTWHFSLPGMDIASVGIQNLGGGSIMRVLLLYLVIRACSTWSHTQNYNWTAGLLWVG